MFHAHAHDMAYLEQWIGEMLDIRRDVSGGEAVGPEGVKPQCVSGGVLRDSYALESLCSDYYADRAGVKGLSHASAA